MKSSKFIEGVHYYMDGTRVVFTALSHIQRGSCCGTGCRHCPYDLKHTKGTVVLAKEKLKFEIMRIEDLQKQVQQLQSTNVKELSPEQLEQMVEQLSSLLNEGEDLLNNEIQTNNNESED